MGEVWIDAGSPAGAGALAGWLRRDPSVARAGVEIEPAATAAAGAPGSAAGMGTVETVTAIVDGAVGVLSLLVAVAAWRRPRATPPPVVRVIENDGTVLEGTVEDVLRTVRARGEREQTST
ncbi:hypothetical protein GCM10018785_73690 [Streptomyces longispororuber]|uniref:Uncharacterized protein n=1 Tax=Streptomyces longispororuber TaxID=68230 RepID=A0A919DYR1_9ACTN|nr:hypothetical protein [Streptomyces longispororuber]GHE99155.1 hypothetical protein GCM10018785_73690 [Streptomyces longispororuber]